MSDDCFQLPGVPVNNDTRWFNEDARDAARAAAREYYEDHLAEISGRWVAALQQDDVSPFGQALSMGRVLGYLAAQLVLESSNGTISQRKKLFSLISRGMRDAYMSTRVGSGD